ncbi:GNAT family N-acetyltransferase [Alkalibacterium kapii]
MIIDHTLVKDELRGQGVGDLLLNKVVDYARENNRLNTPDRVPRSVKRIRLIWQQ